MATAIIWVTLLIPSWDNLASQSVGNYLHHYALNAVGMFGSLAVLIWSTTSNASRGPGSSTTEKFRRIIPQTCSGSRARTWTSPAVFFHHHSALDVGRDRDARGRAVYGYDPRAAVLRSEGPCKPKTCWKTHWSNPPPRKCPGPSQPTTFRNATCRPVRRNGMPSCKRCKTEVLCRDAGGRSGSPDDGRGRNAFNHGPSVRLAGGRLTPGVYPKQPAPQR